MEPHIFIPGDTYKRTEIHRNYGGNGRSGISRSGTHPYIFIFSVPTGELHGYKDGWENEDVYAYTGEGQIGNMELLRNNLALVNHLQTGKRVFLFKGIKKAYVQFVAELELDEFDYFIGPDKKGNDRTAIKFFFKRAGKELTYKKIIVDPVIVGQNQDDKFNGLRDIPDITERKGLITTRVGHGAYRKSILHRWKYRCAVTNYTRTEVLIASHIVPWKDSTNIERLDVDNGILLSPTYDALFDKNLISFEDNGKIILSKEIENSNYQKIGITGKERILSFSSSNHYYLERHRKLLL